MARARARKLGPYERQQVVDQLKADWADAEAEQWTANQAAAKMSERLGFEVNKGNIRTALIAMGGRKLPLAETRAIKKQEREAAKAASRVAGNVQPAGQQPGPTVYDQALAAAIADLCARFKETPPINIQEIMAGQRLSVEGRMRLVAMDAQVNGQGLGRLFPEPPKGGQ